MTSSSTRPSWRRIAALTAVGCVVAALIGVGIFHVVDAGNVFANESLARWETAVEGFGLPDWLVEPVQAFPSTTLILALCAHASAWFLQRLGPREGRWGFWRCGACSLSVGGGMAAIYILLVEMEKHGGSDRSLAVMAFSLLGLWCLAWNLFWAWQVAKREAGTKPS